MAAIIGLCCVAAFLAIAGLAIAAGRKPIGNSIVYDACLGVSLIALASALMALVTAAPPAQVSLPIGLPLVGAHFRVDALAAFFLRVVNLGAAAASLYGLGDGRHEEAPCVYNGAIILIFFALSGTLTAMFIHRFATRATRRSAIWDCGYPDPSVATQYSSSSFAMPIRRVFGTTIFEVHETIDMPRPGETRAGRFHVKIFDPAWRLGYGPLARAVSRVAGRLNRLQFLTIRSYLTLTFAALILLLLVVAAWR